MIRTLSLALAAAIAACAASPVITELRPRGAERGRPFLLTVIGRDIPEGAAISSTMRASFTASLTSDPSAAARMQPARSAVFLVEPRPDLAPGVYPIRIQSASGISNVLLFSIGEFPEQEEAESGQYSPPNSNDTIETAQALPNTPLTVNGTLRGAERDLYRIYGKATERRVFEIQARRSGSAIDPVLTILDGAGKQLARSDDDPGAGLDARLEFTFPREGYYYVEVHDARFSRQTQNFYRLKMGSYPYAAGLFPLGGKQGEKVDVTFFGGTLPAPVKSTIVPDANAFSWVALPGSASAPFLFAASNLPELIEPSQPVPIPSVVNGRLLAQGEIDRYRVPVQPGESLLFEIQARELGSSRIEAVLTVFDPAGKKLDSAGDKPLPEDVFAVQGTSRTSSDPFLNITVPAGVTQLTVAVEDLARRGGPNYGYRLITRRQAEDFNLSIASAELNIPAGGTVQVAVNADRRGYDGPIQLGVTDLPKGIRAEGGIIPREYVDPNNTRTFNRRGVLVLTADRDVALGVRDLALYGEGKLANGTLLRRTARGPGMSIGVAGATEQGVVDRQRSLTAPWLGWDLPAAVTPQPPATLLVTQRKVTRLAEGDKFEFDYQWTLASRDVRPRPNVTVDIIGARDIRVTDQQRAPGDGTKGSFIVSTSKATDVADYDLIVRGRVQSDTGTDEEIVARPLVFKVAEWSSKSDVSSLR